MKRALFVLGIFSIASTAGAQVSVGYPPQQSPFRDLEFHQELTAFGGYFNAAEDPAGVAPQAAPMAGIRYEIGVGGPVQIVFRLAEAFSERNVIDPTKPEDTRNLGKRSWPVYLGDFGLSLNLTGQRSWHAIVPVVNMGIGLASDLDKQADDDPFNVGTTFAFSLGGGLRIVPGGRFEMRADAGTWIYKYKYPTTYYATTADNTTVLGPKVAKDFWKRNLGLTLGASYNLFR